MADVIAPNRLQDERRQGHYPLGHPSLIPSIGQYDYRPVSILASVTLSLSVVSVFAIFSEFGIILAAVGIVLSLFAFRQQKKHQGALGGKLLVRLGCFFSVLFFGRGIGSRVYAYESELLEGHIRVSFSYDISSKKLDFTENGLYRVPEKIVANLVGEKILIKGYMWTPLQFNHGSSIILTKNIENT